MTADDFEVLDHERTSAAGDPMGDGCGWIPESVLQRLLKNKCLGGLVPGTSLSGEPQKARIAVSGKR